MNQSNAADAARQMAEAFAAKAGGLTEAERIRKRVHDAVFNQAFDFIPDSAVYAVVNTEQRPQLVALDDRQFFLLTVGDLSARTVGAPVTTCEMMTIDPLDSSVKCKMEFVGVRTNGDPIERRTSWSFRLGQIKLRFSTHVVPESERIEGGEDFAQTLAAVLGWEFPTAARIVQLQAA